MKLAAETLERKLGNATIEIPTNRKKSFDNVDDVMLTAIVRYRILYQNISGLC